MFFIRKSRIFSLLVASVTLVFSNELSFPARSEEALKAPEKAVNRESAQSTEIPRQAFGGKIGEKFADSIPQWPRLPTAPRNAPNIVLILLDDVGFGSASTFGGPALTPELDRLASQGLKYTRFHTTALCSPTRAALLSGRNQHRIGWGTVSEFSSGFPGYNGLWSNNAASIAEVLKRNGYNTAAFGKWHNTPINEISPIGPFDRWPTGLGFEHFYGFMLGETSQWEPLLYRNTSVVEAPAHPKDGYHLTSDITDEAIKFVQTHTSLAPDKPYFLYFATGATHSPLHAPPEWIAKYRGKFDQGWDRLREEIFARQKKLGVIPPSADLTKRPPELAAWESLTADQKSLYARQMEVYAGFLAHTDHEIGRLLNTIRQSPEGDNTLIIYIVGDNGGSAEGDPDGTDTHISDRMSGEGHSVKEQLKHVQELGGPNWDNHYASAWAWATSTPFQWMKQIASHLGGTRNPMVISWPAHIKNVGGIRAQFTHVIDIAATIYDVTGIGAPAKIDGVEQMPIDGVSLAYTFDKADVPTPNRIQYFEQQGNRAIYSDEWMASARHAVPWIRERNDKFENDQWELYDLKKDFSQAHDVAKRFPEKLKELKALFEKEGRANGVYPLNNAVFNSEHGFAQGLPSLAANRKVFTYYPGFPAVLNMSGVLPDFQRSHTIRARLKVPKGDVNGMIVANGGKFGGFGLYLQHGQLIYENNYLGESLSRIVSKEPISTGELTVTFEYERATDAKLSGGAGRLFVNGKMVAEGSFPHVGPPEYGSTFSVGAGGISSISDHYETPFTLSAELHDVTVELNP